MHVKSDYGFWNIDIHLSGFYWILAIHPTVTMIDS